MSYGMQEDIQKNFILLSKVAKEKMYAQEYMGLLARRGDIGSIRIGKRWYTTWAWFEEFLENLQKKKEAASEVQFAASAVVETLVDKPIKEESKIIVSLEKKVEQVKISAPVFFPERESVYDVPKAKNISSEISGTTKSEVVVSEDFPEARASDSQSLKVNLQPKKIDFNQFQRQVFIKRREQKMDVTAAPIVMNQKAPKKIAVNSNVRNAWNMRREEKKMKLPQIISVQKKNENPLPYKEIKFRENKDVFSPVLGVSEMSEGVRSIFFPKLVFAASFAIMLLLIAASVYFVFSDGISKNGMVAGASDERTEEFLSINSGGEYFLSNAGNKMKEALSISKVAVQAAKEKLVNSEQQLVDNNN